MDHNVRILIAEDSPDYAFFLERVLDHIGLSNSLVVGDGVEMVEYLTGEGKFSNRNIFPLPDLLITDLKMPRMNGFELLQWLQKHPEHAVMPVIVLSSSADEQDVQLAYELGANAYLSKPGGLTELQEMLQALVHFWTGRTRTVELTCA
jgi:CheY-like chemotaxis protein